MSITKIDKNKYKGLDPSSIAGAIQAQKVNLFATPEEIETLWLQYSNMEERSIASTVALQAYNFGLEVATNIAASREAEVAEAVEAVDSSNYSDFDFNLLKVISKKDTMIKRLEQEKVGLEQDQDTINTEVAKLNAVIASLSDELRGAKLLNTDLNLEIRFLNTKIGEQN